MGAPDDFHDDVHPEAREITGERSYGEWGQCITEASSTGERCRGYAQGSHGKCRNHGGATPTAEENERQGRGDQEGNRNAVTHGAFAKHFTSHLTAGEQAAFDDAVEALDSPGGAQAIARQAASICLLQFHRSGNERFLRRFEGLCDKFNIAPTDELEISGEGFEFTLTTEEKDALDDAFDREPQS